MKMFTLFALISLSAAANAASYYCIVAPEVSNQFYEYEYGDDNVTLYAMKLNSSALGYVNNHPRESSFNTETDVSVLRDSSFVKKKNSRALMVIEDGRTTLQVTEPKELYHAPKEVNKNKDGSPLIFAGQIVDSVYFILCGKD